MLGMDKVSYRLFFSTVLTKNLRNPRNHAPLNCLGSNTLDYQSRVLREGQSKVTRRKMQLRV